MSPFTVVAIGIAAMLPAIGQPAQSSPQGPQTYPLSTVLLRSHEAVQRNLVEAAEKMPDEHFAFRATPETKPFGQIVAHIALSRFGACSAIRGIENPKRGVKEDEPRTKAQAVALLKEAGSYCTEAFSALTDETLTQMVAVGVNKNQVARGVFIAGENAHGNEIYGTMAVYLRLKGIVPPSTERVQQRRSQ